MNGITHGSAGVCMGCALSLSMNLPLGPGLCTIATALLGSMFPDIDIPYSTVGRVTRPISTLIQRIFGHRTLFHSFTLYGLAFYLAMVFWPEYVQFYIAFICGVGSHLVLDMMNPSGIQILWPIPWRAHLESIPAGGTVDLLLGTLFAVGAISLGFFQIYRFASI